MDDTKIDALEEINVKNENVFRLSDVEKELWTLSEEGLKKGAYLGFPELHQYYSIKRGSTSYIVAPPSTGKSAILWEFQINLAQFSGWKFLLFSPETGNATAIYAELLWAYMKKPFKKNKFLNASDKEKKEAMKFVSEHFFIVDSGVRDMTLEMCYKAVLDLEEEEGIKIDGMLIDPFTDIALNSPNATHEAIGEALTKTRKFSMQYDVHTFIAFHTRAMQNVKFKDSIGNTKDYPPPPSMYDIAGGQMGSRKGMFIIGLWRTPAGYLDKDGEEYMENETVVEILKDKPKAVGKKGSVRLYYDKWSTRFYMYDKQGNKVYASPPPPEIARGIEGYKGDDAVQIEEDKDLQNKINF